VAFRVIKRKLLAGTQTSNTIGTYTTPDEHVGEERRKQKKNNNTEKTKKKTERKE